MIDRRTGRALTAPTLDVLMLMPFTPEMEAAEQMLGHMPGSVADAMALTPPHHHHHAHAASASGPSSASSSACATPSHRPRHASLQLPGSASAFATSPRSTGAGSLLHGESRVAEGLAQLRRVVSAVMEGRIVSHLVLPAVLRVAAGGSGAAGVPVAALQQQLEALPEAELQRLVLTEEQRGVLGALCAPAGAASWQDAGNPAIVHVATAALYAAVAETERMRGGGGGAEALRPRPFA